MHTALPADRSERSAPVPGHSKRQRRSQASLAPALKAAVARSSVAPLRLPLLQEGTDPFPRVLGERIQRHHFHRVGIG